MRRQRNYELLSLMLLFSYALFFCTRFLCSKSKVQVPCIQYRCDECMKWNENHLKIRWTLSAEKRGRTTNTFVFTSLFLCLVCAIYHFELHTFFPLNHSKKKCLCQNEWKQRIQKQQQQKSINNSSTTMKQSHCYKMLACYLIRYFIMWKRYDSK